TTSSASDQRRVLAFSGWLVAWTVIAILVGGSPVTAGESDPRMCLQHDPVRIWLRQADDQSRSYEDRRTAYEKAIRWCPDACRLYVGLSALLLEHEDAAGALIWIG